MNRLGLALTSVLLLLPSVSARALTGNDDPVSEKVTQFQITGKTQVPGRLLKPGTYSISVVDQLSDRMVLRVTNSEGKEEATFIALPGGSRISKQAPEGPIAMVAHGGNKSALRGFAFSNGQVAEFVYPKDEAVVLAKANGSTVPAVDPASEGRVASPNMSRTDMELVTLWMLTPTLVGSDHQQAIEAKRYQPEVAAAVLPPPPPAVTRRTPTPATVDQSLAAPSESQRVAEFVPPPAPAPRREVAHPIAVLPHTASSLPLLSLLGVISTACATLLSLRRVMSTLPR